MTSNTKKELQIKSNYSIEKIEDIQKMSIVLKEYVKKNNLSVVIQGKDYTMVEGYAFAGMLLGFTPRIASVEKLADNKWLAKTEILNRKNEIVSIGYALCSKEESKKKTFDEYAILSMAQTRSQGKAYRNLIGWVMKMSGFESTPAEEMPTDEQVKGMYEIAVSKIGVCKSHTQLGLISKNIEASKKYSTEQKVALQKIISNRIDQLDAAQG